MKRTLVLLVLLFIVPGSLALGQNKDAAERAAELRAQLADLEAREGELKLRLEQLDEELKPENIQRALAGVGSTRPEELREQRRRQLQIEKDSVVNQLGHLANRRAALESGIASADALAYQQSAQGPVGVDKLALQQLWRLPGWVRGLFITLIAVIGITAAVLIIRRRRGVI
jgi:hypothetical protein